MLMIAGGGFMLGGGAYDAWEGDAMKVREGSSPRQKNHMLRTTSLHDHEVSELKTNGSFPK